MEKTFAGAKSNILVKCYSITFLSVMCLCIVRIFLLFDLVYLMVCVGSVGSVGSGSIGSVGNFGNFGSFGNNFLEHFFDIHLIQRRV